MSKPPQTVKVTWAQTVRDIFVASINKGQLPTAILGLILVIYCMRVPPDVLTAQGAAIINALINGYLIGYAIGIGGVAGWFLHARSLRRKHHDELDRIASEKTELQKQQLGPGKVKSSKNR